MSAGKIQTNEALAGSSPRTTTPDALTGALDLTRDRSKGDSHIFVRAETGGQLIEKT